MSYATWHTYGFGVCISEVGDIPVIRMIELLKTAPETKKDIFLWLGKKGISEPETEDILAYDEESRLGLATILQMVIQEAEGIYLAACDDFDGRTYLLYEQALPWQIAENEKNLTEESVRKIFQKYFSILTDAEVTIDYQSVENGG
ncbi:MAG: hypothetical protein IJ733_13405 [Lachnospiraceae bacterium]|nr:hypothetical protein [Lachnospiraceae bacterium]